MQHENRTSEFIKLLMRQRAILVYGRTILDRSYKDYCAEYYRTDMPNVVTMEVGLCAHRDRRAKGPPDTGGA